MEKHSCRGSMNVLNQIWNRIHLKQKNNIEISSIAYVLRLKYHLLNVCQVTDTKSILKSLKRSKEKEKKKKYQQSKEIFNQICTMLYKH